MPLTSKNYTEFKKKLAASDCRKCGLCESRTNIVVDRGNPDTKVVFIGEAPGANEDLQGKAFVGRAGRLLDQMMKDAGFDTNEDSLIINVVKCRPPKNRQPSPEEAKTCRPYFAKQLELVAPRLIVLLGAVAMRHIFPDKKGFSMRDEVGKFFRHPAYPGAEFVVFFHPAYILRDPRKKPLMAEHIRIFKERWASLK